MRLKEKHIILFFFTSLFILFGILMVHSEAAYGGSDNYSHYRIARFAWKYPHLLLDHWGKPLFTILSSPFALAGFKGVVLFNVIAGLLTSFFAYLTLKKLEYKNAWMIIFFICFTPIYFILMISGLTEILFSLILMFSIYLFFNKRFIASAIIISFIIFSRTEGFIILPLFALGYIIEKKYKPIPFLVTGFVVFSILGFFILNDFWWFFTQNPYVGGKNIYGSGSLTHFIDNTKSINGIPLAIALVIGCISYLVEMVQSKKLSKQILNEIIFFACIYFVYLAAHSIAWWKGIGGSLGLIRVMAAVMPVAAIISLKGFNLIYSVFKFNQFFQYGLTLLFLYFAIKIPFQIYKLPVKRDAREQAIHQAAQWLKSTKYYNRKFFYYDTYFCHELGLDPFNSDVCQERIPDLNKPGKNIPTGSIIEWDAHFSPTSGYLPLDSLMNNPTFKLLKSFTPKNPFKTYAGYDYQVHLFQKVND